MVTHDPYAASYADRVVFLRDGRIVHQHQNNTEGGAGGQDAVQAIIDLMAELEF
jgi:ABC-type sulfate/molybdate transport systems ATPase subunit